jgi:DNA helicase II / ATP-dependent DNA helicase PcrA
MQAGVKYRIRGGRRYIDRKEVQDLLSYLRLLSNPRNLSALKRSINTPSRGIGDKSQLALFKWIEKTNSDCLSKNHIPPTLLDYLYAINLLTEEDNQSNGEGEDDLESSLLDNGGDLDESLHASLAHSCPLTQREKRTLSKYSSVITKLHRLSLNTCLPLTDLVNTLLTTIDYRGYITQLSHNDSENEKERWENIVEILKTADRYSDKRNGNGNGNGGTSLENFIEYYDCFQTLSDGNGNDLGDKAEGESDDLVELMTIHASKGLEFDVVVISGAEEGVLPLTSDGNCEEEERRLAYVAITRAKSLLIITYREHLKRIRTNGSHYRMKTTPSRFLNPLKSIPATNCIWVKS